MTEYKTGGPVIAVEGCSFAYRRERVLQAVSFAVEAGEFVCIIGSNGAGKSTLLRLLLGELAPLEGAVRLFGQEARQFREWPRVGYVPQNASSRAAGFPATVSEVVRLGLYGRTGPRRRPNRAERGEERELLRRTLAVAGVDALQNRRIGELSGGQLQRVMIAKALVGGPELLLLDEPTTGVDAAACDELYELLHRLHVAEGLTVVMVTHDTARAARYLTRCFCLEDGSLVELDRAQIEHELSHRHTHPAPEQRTEEDADDRPDAVL